MALNRLLLGVALTLLVACGVSGRSVSRGHARHCGDLDCPPYEVLKDLGNGIELRRYEPATWAVTDVDETNFDKATTIGFGRLFKYIFGDNLLEQHLDMTAPVVTTAHLDKDHDLENDFSVSFYLPGRDSRPPEPKDDRIEIIEFGKVDAYVLSFGSYALGFRVKRLALDFMDHLDSIGVRDYDDRTFLVAVYDPPYKVWDRRNEIWVLRKKKGPKPPKTDDDDDKKEMATA